jgi:hypothetical protein
MAAFRRAHRACHFTGSSLPLSNIVSISVSCFPHDPMATTSGANATLS